MDGGVRPKKGNDLFNPKFNGPTLTLPPKEVPDKAAFLLSGLSPLKKYPHVNDA